MWREEMFRHSFMLEENVSKIETCKQQHELTHKQPCWKANKQYHQHGLNPLTIYHEKQWAVSKVWKTWSDIWKSKSENSLPKELIHVDLLSLWTKHLWEANKQKTWGRIALILLQWEPICNWNRSRKSIQVLDNRAVSKSQSVNQ